jgi:replicative DNA helicase
MNKTNGQVNNARRFFLHTPADANQAYIYWAEQLATAPGIAYGCVLDKHLIPLHPGDLMAVVARPGHGKSSFMAYMAKREAAQIVRRNTQDKEAVVYVSWEQPIEEIEAFFQSGADYNSSDMAWGRVSMEVIKRKAVQRASLPIWTIGHSLRHANMKKPTMTVDVVYEAIESMYREYGVRPTLVCLDYLQIVKTNKGGDRLVQVTEATYAAKELAMTVGAPIIAGVQAGRKVDEYKKPVPTMSDAQWSSAIEQTADKQISLWRPSKTHDQNAHPSIEVGGINYMNDEDLMVVKLLKQRFERGYGVWAIRFKPHTLQVWDYETREINL